jgi:putative endonuclease
MTARGRSSRPGRAAARPRLPGVENEPVAIVYLLRCADDSLYCGWTVDLERRLAAHAAGKASRYTASRLPVEVAWWWPVATRQEARRLEARIKRLTRSEKLRLLAGASRPAS